MKPKPKPRGKHVPMKQRARQRAVSRREFSEVVRIAGGHINAHGRSLDKIEGELARMEKALALLGLQLEAHRESLRPFAERLNRIESALRKLADPQPTGDR